VPLITQSAYQPPFPFFSGHLQTTFPTLFRPRPKTFPIPERLELADGDFLDLDWHRCRNGVSKNLAVISHGLEGNARKKYPLGMARYLTENDWDVICFNFRGCSGEPNRLPRFYHSGVTDDLHTVINHGLVTGHYSQAALIGFSMGGNQTLKYLGENPALVPAPIKAAVVFSVPCNLADSVEELSKPQNSMYMQYFMQGLREKIRIKAKAFPGLINTDGLQQMKTFIPFDDKYTAPLHGFRDAADYYRQCSSKQFLSSIRIPTLLVQAKDDPFLPKSCYPIEESVSASLFLEIPENGGHVGFMGKWGDRHYWSERRVLAFLQNFVS
jgi:predicted alpha/beta-fold hydrolase